jgi:hypothetical protein
VAPRPILPDHDPLHDQHLHRERGHPERDGQRQQQAVDAEGSTVHLVPAVDGYVRERRLEAVEHVVHEAVGGDDSRPEKQPHDEDEEGLDNADRPERERPALQKRWLSEGLAGLESDVDKNRRVGMIAAPRSSPMMRMKRVWMMQTAQNSGRPCKRWLSKGWVGLESNMVYDWRVGMMGAPERSP